MSTTSQQAGLQSLDIVTLAVADLDEAIEFYTGTLGFETRMDDEFEMGEHTGRWVTVALPDGGVQLALTPTDEPYYDDEMRASLEAKLGSDTGFIFRVEDCAAAVDAFESAGVEITREPTEYDWGDRCDDRGSVRQRDRPVRVRGVDHPATAGDRFCSRCGAALDADAAETLEEQVESTMKDSYRKADPTDADTLEKLDTLDELLDDAEVKETLLDKIEA